MQRPVRSERSLGLRPGSAAGAGRHPAGGAPTSTLKATSGSASSRPQARRSFRGRAWSTTTCGRQRRPGAAASGPGSVAALPAGLPGAPAAAGARIRRHAAGPAAIRSPTPRTHSPTDPPTHPPTSTSCTGLPLPSACSSGPPPSPSPSPAAAAASSAASACSMAAATCGGNSCRTHCVSGSSTADGGGAASAAGAASSASATGSAGLYLQGAVEQQQARGRSHQHAARLIAAGTRRQHSQSSPSPRTLRLPPPAPHLGR